MEPHVPLKTRLEVQGIRKPSRALGRILGELHDFIVPGISEGDIVNFVLAAFDGVDAVPALRGIKDFPAHASISVNRKAAHGIPGSGILADGDVVTVDLVAEQNGWYADSAETYLVGQGGPRVRRLVETAIRATAAGIQALTAGARLGDVGAAIEKAARAGGCRVARNCVGHGIGRSVHEDPVVLPYGEVGTGRPVVPGLVVTVEPIVLLAGDEVRYAENGVELYAEDLAAQFEHIVAVFSDRTEVLTQGDGRRSLDID